jgi:Bacterial Ig domain
MFAPSKIRVGARAIALAFALASSSFSAHAVLQRAGPVSIDPSVGGFPAWYQDTTGIALEFCGPKNAAELAGAWCLLLPANIPAVPEVFPTSFFIEHFYFGASATMVHQGGGKSILTMGQEASFANGSTVRPGDQTTFARIRVSLNPVPVTGTYRFIHPYGEELITAVAGAKIHFTSDVGLGCGLDFTCSLFGRLGPFLLPSGTVGGAEMPPLTAANPIPDTNPLHFKGGVLAPTAYPGTGNAYIADPARLGPVTGSPLPNFIDSTGASRNHNIFRIEGPVGSAMGLDANGALVDWIETTDFALNGRLFTGTLPGVVTVDRASYARNPSAQKLDVFATALQTTQARLPAAPAQLTVADSMTFFDATCAGTLDPVTGAILPPFSAPPLAVETPMKSDGAQQWAQTHPLVIPLAVCVKDASTRDAAGNLVPTYLPQIVTDEVTVTPAFYDPVAGTLTVSASSSDTVLAPTLTLAYATFLGDLVGGQIVDPGMLAPPTSVFVQSSALGITQYPVSTGLAAGAVTGIPVAANDAFPAFLMNSPPQVLAVLANDSNVTGGTVTLTSLPHLGTTVVNPDGTVTFTPNLNAAGTDLFTYTVTVGTQVSNIATATITITSVNLPPVAVNDAGNALVNTALAINVIANDTDPNGAADIVAAVNVTQPTPAGAATSVAGKIVTFTATKTGTYTFTYQAMDAGGLSSASPATVTVQVAAAETLTYTKNEYIVSKSRLVVSGTVSPIAGQTVKVQFVDQNGLVLGTAGTVTSDANGNWLLDIVGIALPTGTVSVRSTTSNGTVLATALTLK